jgi:hypothetical protein
MYRQARPQGAEQPGGTPPPPPGGNGEAKGKEGGVIDAEYVDVDEKK